MSEAMLLPTLVSMPLVTRSRTFADDWRDACGKTRPNWKSWKSLDGQDKRRLLHQVAIDCNDDQDPHGAYVSVYEGKDIDLVMKLKQWSVEHVLPRYMVKGNEPGDAENDPLGWVEATRLSNSRRSNHPLVLWLLDDEELPLQGFITLEGEKHFVPFQEQRARLARKWAFIRATYPDEVAPPSSAQLANANKIFDLMKQTQPFQSEICVNNHFRKTYQWGNPLLEEGAGSWIDKQEFKTLVFKAS